MLALTYIMKSIVLYIFIILAEIPAGMTVNAQKPVLDLIPVQRLLPQPESVPDTTGILRKLPVVRPETDLFILPTPPVNQWDDDAEASERTGTDLHSFFKRRERESKVIPVRPTDIPYLFKYFHPFQMLFQIIAQK